jgi:hypothetical protein
VHENGSFAPSGLHQFPACTQAGALGCILAPLRGWELRFASGLCLGA